jgi:CRP/FNR family transcriptional regulator
MWTMQQILFLKIDQRVAQFLWDEITRKGTATLHITHDEIARYIGSAREVVTKVMKYLSKEKIVELKRGTIEIVDKDKLQKIAM